MGRGCKVEVSETFFVASCGYLINKNYLKKTSFENESSTMTMWVQKITSKIFGSATASKRVRLITEKWKNKEKN